MSAHGRFNLDLLRSLHGRRKAVSEASVDRFLISRRSFLGFSAAAAAGAAIPPILSVDGFSVVREGARILVWAHNELRWIIDAAKFGQVANVDLLRRSGETKLTLRDATFPGTRIPADFECLFRKRSGVWTMALDMACGIRVDAPLLAWLDSQVAAQGQWRTNELRPFEGFELNFRESPVVRFNRDWVFEAVGTGKVSLNGLSHDLPTDYIRIAVEDTGAGIQIAAGPSVPKTSFHLHRKAHSWPVNLRRESEHGWSLVHDEEWDVFDELHIESAQTGSGPLHSALFVQNEENDASLRFFPGGGLVSDSGEPFHFPLANPRLAFALNESPVRSAFVADLSTQPTWAHGEDASYYVAGTAPAPHIELIYDDDQSAPPQLTPGLCQICFPDDAVAMNLKFGVPKPFRITWGNLASPFERLWGVLHLLPSRHAFDVYFDDNPTSDHILQIDRPQDLLSLRFQFKNMRLITGCNPRIVLRDAKTVGLISVIFPPQHVAEEAVFHTDDNAGLDVDVPIGAQEVLDRGWATNPPTVTLCDIESAKQKLNPDYVKSSPAGCPPNGNSADPNTNKDPQRPRTLLSGESRLVFGIPKGATEIPFHFENLLDWKGWEPRVAEVAQTHVDVSNFDNIPKIAEPKDVTAIELPYKVLLSPSELGRWVHSLQPAKHDTNIIELWHTRLAVAAQAAAAGNPPAAPDETNAKDRTMRAIWSPDFVNVDRTCTVDPTIVTRSDTHPDGLGFPAHYTKDGDPNTYDNPFRMTLDSRDRCELVHLTSNYRIPKPDSTCVSKPTGDHLLPPATLSVERMMLTSVGGYLKSFGAWEPAKVDANHQLTVEQWRHIATLGRDHYVRVVYKGYLLPFGHRASLVKVTERKIIVNKDYPQNGFVAILHQRMFIVVQHPIKNLPVLGQPFSGRQIPFRRVEVLTLLTPDIDDPVKPWPSDQAHHLKTQTQSLFWPNVGGRVFPFRFRFTDLAGTVSESSMPVVFADAAVSQKEGSTPATASMNFTSYDAIDLYKNGSAQPGLKDDPWTTASFSNQKVAFAAPTKPGDTQYDADILAFSVIPPPATQNVLDLYKNDLPYFYPTLPYARVSSSSIKRITGNADSRRVVFFPNYIQSGFDLQQNRGEVFLQIHDEQPLTLAFGKTGSVDKAGGLASPDTVVAGFSRKTGAVGGRPEVVTKGAPVPAKPAATTSLTTYSSGNFNPSDFFGGLTSAKILGGIKLSDIIAPLAPGLASNLEKAPQMLEQSVFEIEKVIKDIVGWIQDLQKPTLPIGGFIPNPIARPLAPQAQQVFALNEARIQAHNRTAADPQGSLALMADTVAEADTDRQLVGAIKDYATSLENLLSNPVALAEQTLVDFLTDSLSQAITNAGLSLETQFAAFITALQNDLQMTLPGAAQTALGAATDVLQTFADAALLTTDKDDPKKALISDTLRIARDKLVKDAAKAALLPLSQYAPDLVAVCNVVDTAKDLQKRIGNLTGNVTLGAIPSFFDQLNGILDDMLQIYQSAGFLGIVATDQSVVDEIKAAENDIAGVWRQVNYVADLINTGTSAIEAKVQALEDSCLKLAAKVDTKKVDVAKKVLQNLRQIQSAVASIASYTKQLQTHTLPIEALRRLNQLLQQLQRQILSSLAALQTMIHDASDELANAATAAGVNLTDFEAQLTELAKLLTAADSLIAVGGQPPLEARISQSFARLTPPAGGAAAVGNLLAGPLYGNYKVITGQLSDLRIKLAVDPNNLGLKLLHYDLSLQLQSPLAAGLQWNIFKDLGTMPDAVQKALVGLNKINALADAISKRIAVAISNALCPLKTFWDNFVARLNTDNPTVFNLFKTSLDGVGAALKQLCDDSTPPVPPDGSIAPLTRPSVLIADARNIFAAFKALLDDIRLRITSLSNLPQEAVAFAKQQLNQLLLNIPVPKSVTLSYDWHPNIQPFEPVFLLNEGADFVVSARAEVSLPLPGANPPSVDITASLTNFSINLIGSPSFVIVVVDSLKFTSHNGSSPDCRVAINRVDFGEDMSFVKDLAKALNPSKGPFIELSDGAIKAGYRFSMDSVPSAGMTIMGLAIEVAVALPFNGDPVRCEFGISDQQHPFLLSFGIYGGGGFLQLQLGLDGVQLLQGALEFGLVASISIGPLEGDGFVIGGIYFRIAGSNSRVCGFVHAHGHMDIFGIVSVDVDLYVGICYDNGAVRGSATFSVHVSILFFSETFTLQASYSFGGSNSTNSQGLLDPYSVDPWRNHDELSQASFLVNPSDETSGQSEPSVPEPVFISKNSWKTYLNAFDLEPQGA
jgi:hypothetical protein